MPPLTATTSSGCVGARENNLRGISLDIPKRRLTVFTGVSGSGKSSLVFGTIAAESQRLINETYSAFVQGFMPSLSRPDVDALENLSAAIVVDQERMGANARSTLGTATDVNAMLRIVFSRLGQPYVGPSFHFGFNAPEGMCPACEGLGRVTDLDLEELVDHSKTLNEGAIRVPGYTPDGWYVRIYTESGLVPGDVKVADFTDQQRQDFLYHEPMKVKTQGINLTYEGLVPKVQKSILTKDRDSVQPHIAAFIDRVVTYGPCPSCGGTRLNEAARSSRSTGVSIADACAMQISDLAEFVRGLTAPEVAPLVATLQQTLDSLVEIGLGYLSLERSSGSLSGGEAQRVKMVRHLGSAADRRHLRLRRADDRAASARHRPDERPADPAAGQGQHRAGRGAQAGDHRGRRPCGRSRARAPARNGGTVQFEGTVADLRSSGTLTGRHLDDRARLKTQVRTATGALPIRGATTHNLRDGRRRRAARGDDRRHRGGGLGEELADPRVAAAGRRRGDASTSPPSAGPGAATRPPTPGCSTRSAPRSPRRTRSSPPCSARTPRAPARTATAPGVVYTDLAMMAGVATTCEHCGGKRFQAAVLEYKLRRQGHQRGAGHVGRRGAGLLRLAGPRTRSWTGWPRSGWATSSLGQPLTTLSGGERQRLKLAIHMADKGGIYVLDEPTTGLHLADVAAPARPARPAGRLRARR